MSRLARERENGLLHFGTGKFMTPHRSSMLQVMVSNTVAHSIITFSNICLGAGNSFLGGLAAGLLLTKGDPYQGIGSFTVHICQIVNQS